MRRQPPESLRNIWPTETKISSAGTPGLSPHTRVYTQKTKTCDFSPVSPSPGGLSTWRMSRLEKPLLCQSEHWVYFQSLGVYSIVYEKKSKYEMEKWSDGQSGVTGSQVVAILDYSQICFSFFSMQKCASNLWLHSPEDETSYHNLQRKAGSRSIPEGVSKARN